MKNWENIEGQLLSCDDLSEIHGARIQIQTFKLHSPWSSRVASQMVTVHEIYVCLVYFYKLLSFTELFQLVWIETPTNPSLKMIDIEACAHTVHKHGDIILVVDNTFMSAYFQRPLSLGADICMYSATKYMNGHSDVVMGLVSLNSESLHDRLRFLQNCKY